jgi:hypothetical protein
MFSSTKKPKVLYSFTVEEPTTKEVRIEEVDPATGDKITRTKMQDAVNLIEVQFLRPTRSDIEESERHYARKMSQCLEDGIMTKQMIYKKYCDTGGLYTDEIFKELASLYERYREIPNRFQYLAFVLKDKTPETMTEEEREYYEELQALTKEFGDTTLRIKEIETEYESLFRSTADNMAENYKFRYFIIKGTQYRLEGEKQFQGLYDVPVDPVTKKMNYDDQVERLYELEDSGDPIYDKIAKKALKVYGLFYYRKDLETQEDYQREVEILEDNEKEDAENQNFAQDFYNSKIEEKAEQASEEAPAEEQPTVAEEPDAQPVEETTDEDAKKPAPAKKPSAKRTPKKTTAKPKTSTKPVKKNRIEEV